MDPRTRCGELRSPRAARLAEFPHPPTFDETVAVMRNASDDRRCWRIRAMVVVCDAPACAVTDRRPPRRFAGAARRDSGLFGRVVGPVRASVAFLRPDGARS
jgi:hypothetical protein